VAAAASGEPHITASTTIPLRRPTATSPWIYWAPPLVWIVLNFIASSDLLSGTHTAVMLTFVLNLLHVHVSNIEFLNHVLRKCGHFTAYAILGGLFFRAWRAALPSSRRSWRNHPVTGEPSAAFKAPLWTLRWSALAVASAALAAAFDEWHQSLVPSRTSTPWDVLIDVVGAIFLQLVLMMLWINKEVPSGE
jgi:VanZ family protein